MIDITQVIVALIGLLAAIITTVLTPFVIPWLKEKVGASRWNQLENIVYTAVLAAQQLAGTEKGKELIEAAGSKLDYATARVKKALAEQKITFDEDTIRAAIEAAVLSMKTS